jgi:hypothetical protein
LRERFLEQGYGSKRVSGRVVLFGGDEEASVGLPRQVGRRQAERLLGELSSCCKRPA